MELVFEFVNLRSSQQFIELYLAVYGKTKQNKTYICRFVVVRSTLPVCSLYKEGYMHYIYWHPVSKGSDKLSKDTNSEGD